MELWILYATIGAVSGLLSGLLGIGGGLIIVPALSWLYAGHHPDEAMHLAVATSVACIACTTFSSFYKHAKLNNIQWRLVRQLFPAMVVGSALGVSLVSRLSGDVLQYVFAICAVLIALKMFFHKKIQLSEPMPLPSGAVMAGYGLGISSVSALLGLGGGIMIVPLLNHYRLQMRHVIGTSAACSFIIAVSCVMGRFLYSLSEGHLAQSGVATIDWYAAAGIVSASVVFAPLGAISSVYCPNTLLRRLFALILVIVAARMLWAA